MENKTDYEILWEFQRRLVKVYDEHDVRILEGMDKSFMIDDVQILQSYMDSIRPFQATLDIWTKELKRREPIFNFKKAFDDLCFISREIGHFTGMTILYSPYLDNPEQNVLVTQAGKTVYLSRIDMPDTRFFMYSTSAYEKIYNYWDRIGDILAAFFPEQISQNAVYFKDISTFIPEEHQSSEDYKWFVDFKSNKYAEMNEVRKKIVHSDSPYTDYFHGHLKKFKDLKKLRKLIKRRDETPKRLKEQISFTTEGMKRLIKFIEYLNDNELNDSQKLEKKKKACA